MQKQQLATVHQPSGINKSAFKVVKVKGPSIQKSPLQRCFSAGSKHPQAPFQYTYNYRLDWKNYIHSLPRIPRIKILPAGTGYDAKKIK